MTEGGESNRAQVPERERTLQTPTGKGLRAESSHAGYLPDDDTYCWVCGGAVVKRHCKIICTVCAFTRDCSDP